MLEHLLAETASEVHRDVPASAYRSWPQMNASAIVAGIDADYSPAYVAHALLTEFVATDSMILGEYGHALLLEPHSVSDRFAVWGGGVRRGRDWEEFCAAAGARRIVRAEEASRVETCVKHALSHESVRSLFACGDAEVSIRTMTGGVAVKGRIDWVQHAGDADRIIDVKFTRCIRPQAFQRQALRLRYIERVAAYHHWYRQIVGRPMLPPLIVAIQQSDSLPHDCCVYELEGVEAAWERVQRMIAGVRAAIESDLWPAYSDSPQRLCYPDWIDDDEEAPYEE